MNRYTIFLAAVLSVQIAQPQPRPSYVPARQPAKATPAQTPLAQPQTTRQADPPPAPILPAPAPVSAPRTPATWRQLDAEFVTAVERGQACQARDLAAKARDAVVADVQRLQADFSARAANLRNNAQSFAQMLTDRSKRQQVLSDDRSHLTAEMANAEARQIALERGAGTQKLTPESLAQARGLTKLQIDALKQTLSFLEKEVGALQVDTANLEQRLYLANGYAGYWSVMAAQRTAEDGFWKSYYNALANAQAHQCDRTTSDYKPENLPPTPDPESAKFLTLPTEKEN